MGNARHRWISVFALLGFILGAGGEGYINAPVVFAKPQSEFDIGFEIFRILIMGFGLAALFALVGILWSIARSRRHKHHSPTAE